MRIRRYLPIEALRPFIKVFMIIESENGRANRILPDTSIVMAFRLKGRLAQVDQGIRTSLPQALITGLRKSSRLIEYARNSATLLVIFKDGCVPAFVNVGLHQLFGTSLSLSELVRNHQVAEIEEQLAATNNDLQRISIVQKFLISMFKERKPDQLIQTAAQEIKHAKGNIRIKDLVASLPISRDPFEKRFRRIIGASPKQFAAIVRLRSSITYYHQVKNLTETALAAGYFDQAHFIKDFRTFTMQTPKDFFRSPSFW